MTDRAERMPLEGVRVVDLSIVWAGPHGTRLLGDMGVDVIKVEALTRMDPIRGRAEAKSNEGIFPDGEAGERPFNRHGYFNERNRNKRSLTLDLKAEPTREAFRRLVAVSDVVLDNFASGVMERLGFGYEALHAIQPRLIVVQMPSFGTTGPEAGYRGFGATNDQLSGLVSVTGYAPKPGEPVQPQNLGINASDPIAGAHAAVAILAALERRRRTGQGAFIDLAHRESATRLLGYEVLDYTLNGRIAQPRGNRHRSWVQGVYRCAGEEAWVTVSIRSDTEWSRLAAVLRAGGIDEGLLVDARFATGLRRWKHQTALGALIERWTVARSPRGAAEELQAAGVAAAPVQGPEEYFVDPQMRARDWWLAIETEETGRHEYYGISWKNRRRPGGVRRPFPALGEHNAEILIDLLGYSRAEYESMVGAGLGGTDPRDVSGG